MRVSAFAGSWRLTGFKYRFEDGTCSYPFGRKAFGILMYDPKGSMSVQFYRADRPTFHDGDRHGGNEAERAAAYGGVSSYFGTWSIDENKKTIAHHVQGASFPNREGTTLIRHYVFKEPGLELHTEAMEIEGQPAVGVVMWERL